nr:hypothetical protein HK105_002895 [Polyrhizophydium stewartii]
MPEVPPTVLVEHHTSIIQESSLVRPLSPDAYHPRRGSPLKDAMADLRKSPSPPTGQQPMPNDVEFMACTDDPAPAKPAEMPCDMSCDPDSHDAAPLESATPPAAPSAHPRTKTPSPQELPSSMAQQHPQAHMFSHREHDEEPVFSMARTQASVLTSMLSPTTATIGTTSSARHVIVFDDEPEDDDDDDDGVSGSSSADASDASDPEYGAPTTRRRTRSATSARIPAAPGDDCDAMVVDSDRLGAGDLVPAFRTLTSQKHQQHAGSSISIPPSTTSPVHKHNLRSTARTGAAALAAVHALSQGLAGVAVPLSPAASAKRHRNDFALTAAVALKSGGRLTRSAAAAAVAAAAPIAPAAAAESAYPSPPEPSSNQAL